jgi:hypothetical protein
MSTTRIFHWVPLRFDEYHKDFAGSTTRIVMNTTRDRKLPNLNIRDRKFQKNQAGTKEIQPRGGDSFQLTQNTNWH